MRWILIFIFALAVIFYFFSQPKGITNKDIQSINIPLAEQQRSLLLFENKLECLAHSPCFYASIDGRLSKDPYNALKKCTDCRELLEKVTVPFNLPNNVRDDLIQAKDLLRRDVEHYINVAEYYIDIKQNRPPKRKMDPAIGLTCEAYALIDKVNKAYNIKAMMKGQYINCDVISKIE
jgi:hypothetical protein